MNWRNWLEDLTSVQVHVQNSADWLGELVEEIAETRSRDDRLDLVEELPTIARDLLETARAIFRLYRQVTGKEGDMV